MNTPSKKTILFLFGGESTEHDVSIMSAKNIYQALDKQRFSPVLCYIDRNGQWWHTTTIAKPIERTPVIPMLGTSAVVIGNESFHIDAIFPALHGRNGEDGTVQGLATLLHTPIVGCGLDGSFLAMDKTVAKQLLQAVGIPVVPGETYQSSNMPSFKELTNQLGHVLFVKPARQGSSVGVSKAKTEAEFKAAFREAAKYDQTILIEVAVEKPRELEVAALGSTYSPKISVVGEVVPDREFYDYQSKYDNNSTSQTIIPADIPAQVSDQVREYAALAFTTLHCRGMARIDFFMATDGSIYLNEINTLPGFTNISMYPKLWEASGIAQTELITELIGLAATD